MRTLLSIVLAGTLAAGFTTLAHSADDTKPAAKQAEKGGKQGARKTTAKVGEAAPDFTLKLEDGTEWSLSDAKGKVVVLQWINPECPVCVRVMKDGTVANAMKDAKAQFEDVVYVAINSSAARPSSFDATPAYLKEHKIDLPALFDRDGAVGEMYGARTTPHCFVIDQNGVLVYQGAIDDNERGQGKTNYVVNTLAQLKKGETVSPSETRPYGCSVKYKR